MTKKTEIYPGDKAPEFCLPDKDGNEVCLNNFIGKWIVLYFYPRDMTNGCTLEAVYFTKAKPDFEKKGAVIMGTSPDTMESHCKFADKNDLQITLLSDPEHTTLEDYNVWQLKKMAGKEYMGVVRSTFLIDPKGIVRYVWRKVKVQGHIEEVFNALKRAQTED